MQARTETGEPTAPNGSRAECSMASGMLGRRIAARCRVPAFRIANYIETQTLGVPVNQIPVSGASDYGWLSLALASQVFLIRLQLCLWGNCLVAQYATVSSNRDGERDDDHKRGNRKREPHTDADRLGTRRCDVDRSRCERKHGSHNGRSGYEPEIARKAEHAGNDARWSGRRSVMRAVLLAA